MKKGQRQTRLCNCGCGRPVSERYDSEGRFRGYDIRAIECRGKVLPSVRKRISKTMLMEGRHGTRRPVGSRRKGRPRKGYANEYWYIKVAGQKRWVLEHRYIMEQILGRKLRSDEHIHHKDTDGLNNDPENLQLLTSSEHMSLTNKNNPKEMCECICPNCGVRSFHFKKIR